MLINEIRGESLQNRIKFIDGLRGLAVLLTVLFHTMIFESGFAGVEIFFVISGFIITLLLTREFNQTQTIDIKKFWIRRISRLYPVLMIVVVMTLFLSINFPLYSLQDKIYSQAFYTSLGIENWYEIIQNNSYWANGVQTPFLHVWSICIELQFYIVWPFILKSIFKVSKSSTKKSAWIVLAIFAILVISTIFMSFSMEFDAIYFNPFTRASSFVIGGLFAIIACNSQQRNAAAVKVFTVLLFAAIGVLTYFFQMNNINLFRGYIAIYSVLVATLMYLLMVSSSMVMRILLENRVILFFGRISYSLYLIHVPVIYFLSRQNLHVWFNLDIESNFSLVIFQITVSVILACLAWFFIEKKISIQKGFFACLVVILLPVVVYLMINNPQNLQMTTDTHVVDPKWDTEEPIVSPGDTPVLVVGDSWSRRLAMGMTLAQEENQTSQFSIISYGIPGSSVMNPDYTINYPDTTPASYPSKSFDEYLQYWKAAIDKYHPEKVVIATGNYDQFAQVIDNKVMRVGDPTFDSLYQAQFQKIIDFFKNEGIEIYMTNVSNNAASSSDNSWLPFSDAMNKNFDEIAEKNKNDVHLLDLQSFLADGTTYSPRILNGIYMYDETGHPSYDGSIYIGNWLLDQLQ